MPTPTRDAKIPTLSAGAAGLFAAPDPGAERLASLDSYAQLQTREVGYEQPTAVVYARSEGCFRLRLSDGRFGWLPPEDAGSYFPYRELPIRRLAYLTAEWQADSGLR